MKKLRLLALALALVMLVAVFASCGNNEEPAKEPAPTEPATFSSLINPSAPTLDDVVTKMEAISELDGYVRMTYEYTDEYGDPTIGYYDGGEFIFFEKLNVDTGYKSYKVFSLRNAKVVNTFTNTADVTYKLGVFEENIPMFYAYKSERVWLDAEHTSSETKNIRTMYDASGAMVVSKINDSLDEPATFYNWVTINRDIYTVDKTTGALTKKTSIPRNLAMLDEDDSMLVNNNIYVETDSGVCVYDADFNYVGEWFEPVNVANYKFFVLNDGNVLVQYSKRLAPDAIEYDYYEGNNANTMVKYDLVTEIFSIADKTTKNVDCASYISTLVCNNYLRTMYTMYGKDAAEMVGDFENIAIIYPIQDKKINTNDNVIDMVLTDNNAAFGKSLKLVDNQTGLPTKYSDNLYLVQTTYGYALTDVEGKVIKQMTANTLVKVGEYLLDNDGIYNLNYESVYNFDEKNATNIGYIDNTIFVRQYANAEKNGDYTVLAFSKGEPKEITKYVKANENNVIFDLNTNLDVYSLYNQETKLYTYYNADGTALLKDFANSISGYNVYGSTLVWYVDSSNETPIVKYVAVSGNFDSVDLY